MTSKTCATCATNTFSSVQDQYNSTHFFANLFFFQAHFLLIKSILVNIKSKLCLSENTTLLQGTPLAVAAALHCSTLCRLSKAYYIQNVVRRPTGHTRPAVLPIGPFRQGVALQSAALLGHQAAHELLGGAKAVE